MNIDDVTKHLPDPVVGQRFADALAFAVERHSAQARKGSSIPYVAHLLHVCAIVLENGGSEDQAIAGLLHDAIEDAPSGEAPWVRHEISARFGDAVLAMVEACTDADVTPKPPWRNRKEEYLRHLVDVQEDALLVSMADKLHNANAILNDLHVVGDQVWLRFTGGQEGSLWYYRALVEEYRRRNVPSLKYLFDELDKVVSKIEGIAADGIRPAKGATGL